MLLIVILPLGLMTWAALRMAEGEQARVRQRFRTLTEYRLRDINGGIVRWVDETEREMNRITSIDDYHIDSLRERNRSEPRVLQLFVLSDQGELIYPNPAEPLNSTEQSFLIRASRMFTGQDLQSAIEQQSGGEANSSLTRSVLRKLYETLPGKAGLQQKQTVTFDAASGWFNWYWDRGVNLIYWQRRPNGEIVGAALERARWMADLIAELPDTQAFDSASQAEGDTASRIRLVNSASDSVYQWGAFEVDKEQSEPFCEIPVTAPLSSWRLQCFVADSQLNEAGNSAFWGVVIGLVAVGLALISMVYVLYSDYSHDMRQAAQQVSFVNQVSHELKTPLTNIRMYAELLESDLGSLSDESSRQPRQRLSVILSEGQRLTRLIGNVLTFARSTRNRLTVNRQLCIPDQVIRGIVERFEPTLERADITVKFDGNASKSVHLDGEFVEQIVGNLVNNVEKYASSGKSIHLQTELSGNELRIVIADKGPGIPDKQKDRIFEPFSRVSDDVSHPAGTGIGLSIARGLARVHGGDVVLQDSDVGCTFVVTLDVSPESMHSVITN